MNADTFTPDQEAVLNNIGDKLARMLQMRIYSDKPRDSMGRTRWATSEGDKTGLGLIRTIERFFEEAAGSVTEEIPDGPAIDDGQD